MYFAVNLQQMLKLIRLNVRWLSFDNDIFLVSLALLFADPSSLPIASEAFDLDVRVAPNLSLRFIFDTSLLIWKIRYFVSCNHWAKNQIFHHLSFMYLFNNETYIFVKENVQYWVDYGSTFGKKYCQYLNKLRGQNADHG